MLTDKENTFSAIFENFPDGLLVFDEKDDLLFVNPKAESFLGVEAGRLVNKSISQLKEMPSFEPLMELLDVGTGSLIKEAYRERVKIKDDQILKVTTAFLSKEEEKSGTLVILHEITKEKMIERMKTEFVSLSAHQLRTPLSAIKWTLKMLLDGDIGKITKEQKNFIEKIYQSNERMIFLINDLLNITRIEEGTYIYKAVLGDIEPIIKSVAGLYEDEIKKRKMRVEIEEPKEKIPQIKMDAEKIELAFQNFFDNAMRYTHDGGEITVSLKNNKKGIEVIIKDSGIGIPKDQQERVFTRFFRAANVMREGTDGTGLGLFITKNIIEAHGGKAWFESEENKGSTFHFSLPIE